MDKARKLQRSGGEILGRKLLSELLCSPHNLIYRYDLVNDRFTYISQVIESITGIAAQTVLSDSNSFFLPYIHPDDKNRLSKLLKQVKSDTYQTQSLTLDYRFRHAEGHDTWISDNIAVIRSDEDHVLIGNARKVPWKNLQNEFDESKDLLCRYLPFPYFRSRISDGKLLACNDVLWKSLNYKNRDECLKECYLSDYYPSETRHLLIGKLLKDGYLSRVEVETTFKGKTIWAEVNARYFPEQGYIEGISRDISPLKLLTPAEKAVLDLVLQGLCNKEIAHTLSRSVRTVEDHRAHIMQKLNAQNLIDLVQKTYLLNMQPF
jgi:DNA-binding CsgD family transcriptional regulator